MKNTPTKSVPIKPSEITPEAVYLNRRQFIKTIGLVGAGTFLAACTQITPSATTEGMSPQASETTDELGDSLNSYSDITNYNNYYEFTTDKRDVARLSQGFVPNQGEGKLPYQVEVYGLVNKPKTFALEDLLKFPQEERIYRLRCVEGWSMVIPWNGFPLANLLKRWNLFLAPVTFVLRRFMTPSRCPGSSSPVIRGRIKKGCGWMRQ